MDEQVMRTAFRAPTMLVADEQVIARVRAHSSVREMADHLRLVA